MINETKEREKREKREGRLASAKTECARTREREREREREFDDLGLQKVSPFFPIKDFELGEKKTRMTYISPA